MSEAGVNSARISRDAHRFDARVKRRRLADLRLRIYGIVAICFAVGMLVPGLRLDSTASDRQLSVSINLPSAIDLMMTCIDAGLSVEQAIARVSQEFARSSPVLAEEFAICAHELDAGVSLTEALRRMAHRVNLDDMSGLCSVISQADGYKVVANAQKNGSEGGAITVNGFFRTNGRQEDLEITFTRADYGTFKGTGCYAEYNSAEGVSLGYEKYMGVAAGRVWARAVCDKIARMDQGEERACRGTVTFRFEECAQ